MCVYIYIYMPSSSPCIFAMGDNRNDSKDSHIIGQIPLENLVGRAEMVFFPPGRLRLFNFPR